MKLHQSIFKLSEAFSNLNHALALLILEQGKVCEDPGLADSKGLLAQTMANQVYGEFQYYYEQEPRSSLSAVCWLQKVFVMCRMFGSEEWVESKNHSPRVGTMIDPASGLTFAKLTALDRLELDPSRYGDAMFNKQLHDLVREALERGQPTQALRLLCDSVKHGVLSPAINLVTLKTAQQIYSIGLMAMIESVGKFLNRGVQQFEAQR
ncbi:hypothetical protein ACVBEF_01290 [Glaciimonas sp. GG7]